MGQIAQDCFPEAKPTKKKSKRKTTADERVYLYLLFEHKSKPDGNVRLHKRLPRILGLLHELTHEESVMEMLQTVLLYATEVSSVVSEDDIRQSVKAVVTPERREAMEKTLAQKWIAQGREEGKKEGKEEGREEGKVIAQRQTLLRLLAKRFPTHSKKAQSSLRILSRSPILMI